MRGSFVSVRFSGSARAFVASLALAALGSAQGPSLRSDRPDYTPGATVVLTGSGFAPEESVTLSIGHADGSPTTGAGHDPWTLAADASGSFLTTWSVCSDCTGNLLLAMAEGGSSGGAGTMFVSHDCGDGVVTSVTPVGASCSDFTPAVGAGPDNYEVQQGGTYTMTIVGVTECSGDTITVFVQSSSVGNFCFPATGGSGTYVGTFTMPNPACGTMPVSYKCGAGASCTHPGSFAARGPTSGCGGVHLRTSNFDGSCNKTSDDDDCSGTGCTPCVLTCPPDVSVDCAESTSPTNTGTPSGCTSPSFSDSVTPGSCAGNRVITRHWSAPDGCGGTASCDQIITVTDTTGPDIDCPPDVSVDCQDPTDPGSTGSATATDDCSGVASIAHGDSVAPGNCAGNFVITRTWTATDGCGNSSSCVQTITVTDTTAPDIDCPPDVGVDCSAPTDPGSTGSATATDDCSGVASIAHGDSVAPGNCAGNFVITRTWTATDGCGNSSSCVQTITVTDTTAPDITCPPDLTVTGCCVAAGIGMATATDDCSDVTVTNDSPGTFCAGATVVTWTATDECGNSSSCQQTVTVVDVTLDFETDGAGDPLLHGQSLATPGPEAPWTCVTVTGGPDPVSPGDGNNGAAVFDSTNGPFGQDPDLGVGLGNVLYLQRNGGPTDDFTGFHGPDTWDHPNDDEDGGTLTFDFCAAVEAQSIDLIDIDPPGVAQDASVVLTDGAARTRTYTVPGGWTANGPGALAVGTLDLTATGPQPGVAATATVSTQSGFDADDVRQVKVRFGSSGACDNLRYCPNAPQATATVRNGSGENPVILTPASMPIPGSIWMANLDCQAFGGNLAMLTVRGAPMAGTHTPSGEVLIDGCLMHRSIRPVDQPLTWVIPNDLSLCGLGAYVQGLCMGSGASPAAGPKIAPRSRMQLSNALDLLFGF
jgi:hypothetical protein